MAAAAPARATRQEDFTHHQVFQADARLLTMLEAGSVHLVCTSPPYGALKEYPDRPGQLGNMASYEEFLAELDKVWRECFRVLVPGGRVACVVGDVCISRRRGGRHHVLPLSADIQVRARNLGFDCLTPIRWLKVANIVLEASRSSRYLGKPNLPNGVVKNDLEHILFLRKPGGYRSPTPYQEEQSFIPTDDYVRWFSPVWTDVPGQLRRDHPAPYPLEVPRRLIRMFSFVGDVVLDPFAGDRNDRGHGARSRAPFDFGGGGTHVHRYDRREIAVARGALRKGGSLPSREGVGSTARMNPTPR